MELLSSLTAMSWAMASFLALPILPDWSSGLIPVSCAIAMLQLFSVLLDCWWLRWTAALILGWFWAVLAIGVWLVTPWAPAAAIYAGWCGVNLLSVVRLPRFLMPLPG